MKCTKCYSGEYQHRKIVHTVMYHGDVVIIENVPSEVCTICGDTLLHPDTVRNIERLLEKHPQPQRLVPLLEYA